jgi:regulator of cell morphogenesis and NO signaling
MTKKETLIGDIVANDFRTAEVFKKANIDFCCGGNVSLQEACLSKGIDPERLIHDLTALSETPDTSGRNYKEWDLDFLCDYLINSHHKYVKKTMPELEAYAQKIASVHGEGHPELKEVSSLFSQLKSELDQHLKNEEEVLFPAIKEVLKSGNKKAKDLIHSEIERMNGEHEFAGGAMDRINQITQHYQLPQDACNTYQVTFKMLEQFEDDLHIHVHLENNILFKKALEL